MSTVYEAIGLAVGVLTLLGFLSTFIRWTAKVDGHLSRQDEQLKSLHEKVDAHARLPHRRGLLATVLTAVSLWRQW